MKTIFYVLFLLVILGSCNDKSGSRDSGVLGIMDNGSGEYAEEALEESVPVTAEHTTSFYAAGAVANQQSPQSRPPVKVQPERKLIKDGSLKLRTDNIKETKTQLDRIVSSHKAEYGVENFVEYPSYYKYLLRIDVPSKNFDDLVDAIESTFEDVENKEIKVRDVTAEFVDLQTRLESKLAYLARYREILAKAKTVEEILMIEGKIRVIEEEIESTKGRLRYLGSLVSTGHLEVTIIEDIDIVTAQVDDGFLVRFKDSFLGGWNFMVSLFYFLVRIWPLLLFGAIGWFIYRRTSKRTAKS